METRSTPLKEAINSAFETRSTPHGEEIDPSWGRDRPLLGKRSTPLGEADQTFPLEKDVIRNNLIIL
jgi:hypothetical protein